MLTYLFSTARLLLYYTSIVLQLISEMKNCTRHFCSNLYISMSLYVTQSDKMSGKSQILILEILPKFDHILLIMNV